MFLTVFVFITGKITLIFNEITLVKKTKIEKAKAK